MQKERDQSSSMLGYEKSGRTSRMKSDKGGDSRLSESGTNKPSSQNSKRATPNQLKNDSSGFKDDYNDHNKSPSGIIGILSKKVSQMS